MQSLKTFALTPYLGLRNLNVEQAGAQIRQATKPTTGDRYDLISEPNRLYHRENVGFAFPKGSLDCVDTFGRTIFRDDLAKIDVPTLVIHGDSGAIVPFEIRGKPSHEAIADSSLALIEGAPHGFNATHAEQFNCALLDFLG